MTLLPPDITWKVAESAKGITKLHKRLGSDQYDEIKLGIQVFLCSYFSEEDCDTRQGDSICPIGGHGIENAHVLKIRFRLPGKGKSHALRLVVITYCDDHNVVVAESYHRKDDPKTSTMIKAARRAAVVDETD